jgi:membrane-bound serine protease (ClpP class)
MSPGSNIGAATPVSSTGQDLDETLASKVENDAAALIRSIAQERGRNAELLEETVREAASYTALEAVDGNVVDFIAEDLENLLLQLNGQTAETSEGTVTLETEDLGIRELEKNLLEKLLEFLADPNVSFLLLSIGGLGIVIELFNPGLLVPVIVGGICLILAFVSLGNLPVNWAGVALILLAIVLAAAEVAVVGFGVLGVASVVSLVLGGLFLFAQFGDSSPTLPHLGVNRWLIASVAGAAGLSVIYLAREAVKSRRERQADAAESIVGKTGSVTVPVDPRGAVRVANDTWTAESADGSHISAGEKVRVVSIDGLVLTVARQDPPD